MTEPAQPPAVPPEPQSEGEFYEEEYEVEEIKAYRHSEYFKGLEYLVKWKGYDDSDNTWQAEDTLSAPLILKAFWQSYIPPKPARKKDRKRYKTELNLRTKMLKLLEKELEDSEEQAQDTQAGKVPAEQPIEQPIEQPVGQTATQPATQPATRFVTQAATQLLRQPVLEKKAHISPSLGESLKFEFYNSQALSEKQQHLQQQVQRHEQHEQLEQQPQQAQEPLKVRQSRPPKKARKSSQMDRQRGKALAQEEGLVDGLTIKKELTQSDSSHSSAFLSLLSAEEQTRLSATPSSSKRQRSPSIYEISSVSPEPHIQQSRKRRQPQVVIETVDSSDEEEIDELAEEDSNNEEDEFHDAKDDNEAETENADKRQQSPTTDVHPNLIPNRSTVSKETNIELTMSSRPDDANLSHEHEITGSEVLVNDHSYSNTTISSQQESTHEMSSIHRSNGTSNDAIDGYDAFKALDIPRRIISEGKHARAKAISDQSASSLPADIIGNELNKTIICDGNIFEVRNHFREDWDWMDKVSKIEKAIVFKSYDTHLVFFLVRWNDGILSAYNSSTVRHRCPQKVVDFYEEWVSTRYDVL